jgi:hypothetical protein
MLAFDREYGLPDAYFVVAQLARAVLAPWAKEPAKAEDFVPYFAPQPGPAAQADRGRPQGEFRPVRPQAERVDPWP